MAYGLVVEGFVSICSATDFYQAVMAALKATHEVSSCGFWLGGGAVEEPMFYAYAYPVPQGFRDYPIEPKEAFFSSEMREFILPYEAVRRADDPDAALLAFLQSTYETAANLGHWDRVTLERDAKENHDQLSVPQ